MFVLLVISVAVLPWFVRLVASHEERFVISGFEDLKASAKAEMRDQVPVASTMGRTADLPVWRPDPNTDYVCRSPNGGEPCPEGTFCDGSSQSCVRQYVGGEVPTEGYYA